MKRKAVIIASLFLGMMFMVRIAHAGEIDLLVQKLVEKGVLTGGEAQQIVTETREEMRKNLAKGEADTIPKWIQNLKLSGDLRLRYELAEYPDSSSTLNRDRGRIRLRLGLEGKVNDQLKAKIRIASGTGEQTSTNQTFTGGFQGKALYIDQAYMAYSPRLSTGALTLLGGKISNPFYTTDLMWDGDINPEGVGLNAELPVTSDLKPFANVGAFFLYESSSLTDEPTMFGGQLGFSGKLMGKDYKVGATYYDLVNLEGDRTVATIFPGKQLNTNTLTSSSQYAYDFNIVDLNAEITPLTIDLLGQSQPLKLYGNYLTNVAPNVQYDTGWLAGFQLGKAKAKGSWDLGYQYRVIEKDAMVAELVDSDFHGGGTNARGHKIGLNYAILDNTTLGLTFFNTRQDIGAKNYINIGQADVVVKF